MPFAPGPNTEPYTNTNGSHLGNNLMHETAERWLHYTDQTDGWSGGFGEEPAREMTGD
jgi:hypothetical protein